VLMKAMEGEGKSGATQWTTSQSSFVQTYLANLILEGNKTSTVLKRFILMVVLRLSMIILRSIGLLIRFLIT
jgi:hypothetical protein